MTWERPLSALLDDLEQQAEGAFAAERDAEVAERARTEYAGVTLAARMMAAVGHDVAMRVTGVGELAGRLARVADGWCLLEAGDREQVVTLGAVAAVRGLPAGAVPVEAWPVTARLGLGSALRRLAEEGGECGVRLRDGTAYDGRLGRVGADFTEVATTDQSAPVAVAHAAVATVQRRHPG